MGRRPDSKSDEFLIIFILGTEIWRCECTNFPIHRYTYWDFESTAKPEAVGTGSRLSGITEGIIRHDPMAMASTAGGVVGL